MKINQRPLSAGILLLFLIVGFATAQPAGFDENTDGIHAGVMSCYGSTCHGRQESTGVVVLQNEIQIWQDETTVAGAHVRAYKILFDDRSQAIAEKMNIGAAHTAPECLSCHSDPVPASLRGPQFQISDGIGCEACHGASGGWLTSHYAEGATHAENISNGLYPTEDPLARADLCLSCHLGSSREDQFVSHRLMAAGHPRMSFELDLFTALQAHHLEDYDYEERKGLQGGARVWAIGQAKALQNQLDLFGNSGHARDGLFPELIFYDCFACHREISDDPNWRPVVRENPLRPDIRGVPKFNDAHMIMLSIAASSLSDEARQSVDAQTFAFHRALETGIGVDEEITAYMALSARLIRQFQRKQFTRSDYLSMIRNTLSRSTAAAYTDYQTTEQVVMAVDTLLNAMVVSGMTTRQAVSIMREDLEIAYDAVLDPNDYDQDQLIAALDRIAASLETI